MKIKSIKKVKPQRVYAIQTSTGTFIADGIATHNCYVCNKIKNGNWVKYERVMVKRHGRAKVEKMKIDAEKTVKMNTQDMIDLQAKYKKKIEDLGGFPKNI